MVGHAGELVRPHTRVLMRAVAHALSAVISIDDGIGRLRRSSSWFGARRHSAERESPGGTSELDMSEWGLEWQVSF